MLKALEIVAYSHGERQEFLKCLLRLVEGQTDPAWLEVDTRGKVYELLRQDLHRSLHQELGPFDAILFELRQNFSDFAAAPSFIITFVALGKPSQVGDEGIPIGQAVRADIVGDAGSEDLLGAAAPDAEEELYGGAIDEWARERFDLAEDVVDSAIPKGFCGHWGASLC